MKHYNASIYFTPQRELTPSELEQKINLALCEWLNISDVHVELVDEQDVPHKVD
jgi:hypothetical protein